MATEYRLSYTAQEIDAKLGKVSILEEDIVNKQDKLTFDNEPVEGSENPISSGGVFNALQNVGGGSVDLTAGDLIEIKDGVIRSTLGDLISDDTEETFVEFHHADNIEMGDQGDGTYVYGAEGILTSPIDINEKLTIEFNLSDSTNKTFNIDVTSEYDGEGTLHSGLYNCISGDDGLIKVDENLDAIYFECGVINGEEFSLALVTFEDYTGASVTIAQSKVVERKVYATLPDNALRAGDLIKIENGVVSSTLGTKTVSTKESEFLNVSPIPSDCYGDGQTVYSGECDCIPSIGDKVNVEITLANSDVPIYFNDVTVKSYQHDIVCILVNSDQTIEDFDSNGIIKKDENLPDVFCGWLEEDGVGYYTLTSSEDITGASIKVSGTITKEETVKLPNEALSFDEEPIEGSENLVSSGCIYNILGNMGENFGSELDNKQDKLTFDSAPTEGSENPVTSGGVYTALQNIEVNGGDGGSYEPQLVEGLFYGNDLSTRGLSANRNALPVAIGAWIEGGASRPVNIVPDSSVTQAYLSVDISTSTKGTTTTVLINATCTDSDAASAIKEKINKCNFSGFYPVVSIIFEDLPNKTYYIRLTDMSLNGSQFESKFVFVNNQDTFPTNTAISSRIIQSLIVYPQNGNYSHAEGSGTMANGDYSHSEGRHTTAKAGCSHAEGDGTIANGMYSHVEGKYNIADTKGTLAHIVGNGTADDDRSNAHTIDWSGNAWFAGNIEANALILPSSVEGSTKRFRITVNDSGQLSVIEV